MKNLEGRLRRIEETVNKEEELTEDDLALVFSVLPVELVEAIKVEWRKSKEEKSPAIDRQSTEFQGTRKQRLLSLLKYMPKESAEALKREIERRGI